MADVWIVDAVRTPTGRHGGALAGVRPDDLAAAALGGLVRRQPDLDPARIEDVVSGNANGAGEDNRNVARMAVLLAGLPVTVPGATVNRLCGSGWTLCSKRAGPWPWPWGTLRSSSQEAFALDSHRKAATAWAAREFADEVVAVPGATLASDESIREDTTVDQLSQLRPAFRPDGTVTAGNSSPLNDGAAGLLLANGAGLAASGGWPLARIVSRAVSGVEPQRFGIGPVTAAARALERAGIGWSDLASVELNEALAAQSLACPGRVAVKPRGDLTLLGWRRHGGSYFRSPCRELLR